MAVCVHFPTFVTINHNHKTVTKMQYFEIAVKLITGMIGILVFLRIAGKAQMAQLTPLDTDRKSTRLNSSHW